MAQRTNEAWLADLRAGDERQAQALEDLRLLILRGLPLALGGGALQSGSLTAALAEDVAQETLLRVLGRLDSFEGRSAFTTWVQKIAVREALSELRRRRWAETSLPGGDASDAAAARLPAAPDPSPEQAALRADLLRRVQAIIAHELTPKQRAAVVALAVQGLPLEETAQQLKMKPNAVYKLMHDARRRLKRRLNAQGLTVQEVLAAFEATGR